MVLLRGPTTTRESLDFVLNELGGKRRGVDVVLRREEEKGVFQRGVGRSALDA